MDGKRRIGGEDQELGGQRSPSDQNFRNSLDNSPVGIRVLTGDGQVLYANRAILDMWGYSSFEEFSRLSAKELYTPESYAEHLERKLRRQQGERGPSKYETSIVRRDGEVRRFEVFRNEVVWDGVRQFQVLYQDVTERKLAEATLSRRLEFERLIAAVSRRFLGATDIDGAVNDSLADMGKICRASRAYLFLFRGSGAVMDNTHEWCAEGVTPQIANLQNLPCEEFPWWMGKLRCRETIHIEDVARLLEEASTEKHILELQDIKSLIVLPVLIKGELAGFIGFDNVVAPGAWRSEDVSLLQTVSEIIAGALWRQRSEIALKRAQELAESRSEQLATMNRITAAISSTLHLRTIYRTLIAELPRLVQFDRLSVALVKGEQIEVSAVFDDFGGRLPPGAVLPLKSIMGRAIKEGRPAITPDLRVVESSEEARSHPYIPRMIALGLRSTINIPLTVGGRTFGSLNLAGREIGKYSQADLEYLMPVASQLALALENGRLFSQVETAAREWERTFDSMDDGILILDSDLRIVRSNQGAARLLSSTPELLAGQHCYRVVHGKDGPVDWCPAVRCRAEKKYCTAELLEPTLGNRWLEVSCSPVVDVQGELQSIVHVVRDISERKRLQEAVREAGEHRYRKLMETAHDAIFVADAGTGTIVECNQKASQLLGLPADKIIGLHQSQLHPPEERERYKGWFAESVEAGQRLRPDAVVLSSKGDHIWVDIGASVYELEGRKFITGVFRDVTERREAEERLRSQRSTLEAIVGSIGEGLIVADNARNVVYCNRAAGGLLGLEAGVIVGRPVDVFYGLFATRVVEPPDWRETLRGHFREVGKRSLGHYVVRVPERREIQASFFTIESQGKRIGTGAVLRDVTREKEVDRLKSEFVSIASHELRTPMSTIFGFSELLLVAQGLSEEHRAWAKTIHRESERLTAIIDDLLNVSRIENGSLSLRPERLSLDSLLAEIVERLKIRYVKHSFVVELSRDFPPVLADRQKVTQVLINLLDNAAKYSPGGGEVRVTGRDEGKPEGVVAVADRGIGIPAEEMPRLFSRFHRVRTRQTEGIRGTGLGLYIVKSLVEQMKGRVWAKSVLGEGSTFYIALPLAPAGPESPPPTAPRG